MIDIKLLLSENLHCIEILKFQQKQTRAFPWLGPETAHMSPERSDFKSNITDLPLVFIA